MKNFSLSKDIYSIIKSINLEANSFNNKNIVISGSFGFIGKYILECLLLIKKKMNIEEFMIPTVYGNQVSLVPPIRYCIALSVSVFYYFILKRWSN